MLQTLNIPSSPLPEVPSAPTGTAGDAGERAEFAQLLHQAKAVDAEGAHDTPAVATPKEARAELRARPGTPRGTHEHKARAVPSTRAGDESAGSEAIDLAGCMKQHPLAEAMPAATDAASEPHVAKPVDALTPAPAPAPDAAALPVRLHTNEPLPAAAAQPTGEATGDERGTGVRVGAQHIGAREPRLLPRLDVGANVPGDAAAAHALSADAPLANGKDGAFDVALRQASAGRTTGAPLFDRTPLESNPAAAQAAAFTRELAQPPATRPAAAEASLHAGPGEAGFAPALGAQVTLWVKDGVQEARLQLHPADLGPVTVQIALDGQAAHIDFTAAVAATRESIEQSLPALAAALRESGFTLAGGGVFGRSGQGANDGGRERAPDGRGARGTAAIVGSSAGETVALPPRRWARSLLDVYA